MLPFHIYVENEVSLYQLKDGRFQTTRTGSLSSIMIGFKYILLKNEVAAYFQSLAVNGVTFEPAVIWNRSVGKEYTDYQQMCVEYQFSYSEVKGLDLEGRKFLVMNDEALFASPELATMLAQSGLDIVISEGFVDFAG